MTYNKKAYPMTDFDDHSSIKESVLRFADKLKAEHGADDFLILLTWSEYDEMVDRIPEDDLNPAAIRVMPDVYCEAIRLDYRGYRIYVVRSGQR